MSTALGCVGLPTTEEDLHALVDRVLPVAQVLGTSGPNRVVRWEDPSGARLVLEVGEDGVVDLLPSFRAPRTVVLGDLEAANADVVHASLLDHDGKQLTSASLALEQRQLLPRRAPARLTASVAALGVDVACFPDAEAFAASAASLLDPDAEPGEPPESYTSQGWAWPPRVAASSFFSYGVFADAADATAHARLSGSVRRAERRVVRATGNDVVVVELEAAGFELTVCLEGADHDGLPAPGSILSGTVVLVASLVDDLRPPRRRLWTRRT